MRNWKDISMLCAALLILFSFVVAGILDSNSVPKENTQVNSSSINNDQDVEPAEAITSDEIKSTEQTEINSTEQPNDWDYYRGERVYDAIIEERVAIEDLDEEYINLLVDYLNENPQLIDEIEDIVYSSEMETNYSSHLEIDDPIAPEEPAYLAPSFRLTESVDEEEPNSLFEEEPIQTEESFKYHHHVDTTNDDNSIGRLTSNPYAGYENPYDSNSINNPYGKYGSPYSPNSANNPYATDTPELYDSEGNYRGKLSSNPYDPDSISNPYGRYGSPYSSDSINNPYGAGSPYRYDSPNNPYGTGWTIVEPEQ